MTSSSGFALNAPGTSTWDEVIYALVLNGELEEALRLLEAMEDGSDERLPRPTCAAYAILMPALATYEGIPAARRLIARQMARGIHVDSLSHLLMAVIYAGRGAPEAEPAVAKGARAPGGAAYEAFTLSEPPISRAQATWKALTKKRILKDPKASYQGS